MKVNKEKSGKSKPNCSTCNSYSQTTLLLQNGINAFWFICFLCGVLPLAIISIIENYKSYSQKDGETKK